MIDWCRLPGRKGLALVLMIAMFNSSIKLTAANLFNLSLSTFGDVSNIILNCFLNLLAILDLYVVSPINRWLAHQSPI